MIWGAYYDIIGCVLDRKAGTMLGGKYYSTFHKERKAPLARCLIYLQSCNLQLSEGQLSACS